MKLENLKALVYGHELAQNEFESLISENKLLKFMVENGLGEEDFKNDITLPTDI